MGRGSQILSPVAQGLIQDFSDEAAKEKRRHFPYTKLYKHHWHQCSGLYKAWPGSERGGGYY